MWPCQRSTRRVAIRREGQRGAGAGSAGLMIVQSWPRGSLAGWLSDVSVGDRLSTGDTIVTIEIPTSLLGHFEVPERSTWSSGRGQAGFSSATHYAGAVFSKGDSPSTADLNSVTRKRPRFQLRIENCRDGFC